MAFTELDQARDDARYRIRTYSQALGDGDEAISKTLFAITWEHRQLAICKLLQNADLTGYHAGLRRSALTWGHLLKLIDAGMQVSPRLRMGSSWSCLASVVAANDFALGRSLAVRFPKDCDDDREYAEDFFPLAMFSHALTNDANPTGMVALCDQWEQAVEGKTSPDLAAWRAMSAGDSKEFKSAFRDFVDYRKDQMTAYRKSFSHVRTIAATEGGLFISGLAMLQVARRVGLELPPQRPMCPLIALVPTPTTALPLDAWRLLD